jgi:hypothetical protein
VQGFAATMFLFLALCVPVLIRAVYVTTSIAEACIPQGGCQGHLIFNDEGCNHDQSPQTWKSSQLMGGMQVGASEANAKLQRFAKLVCMRLSKIRQATTLLSKPTD